jgi:hypothetical protein
MTAVIVTMMQIDDDLTTLRNFITAISTAQVPLSSAATARDLTGCSVRPRSVVSSRVLIPGRRFREPGASFGGIDREPSILEFAVGSGHERLGGAVDPCGVPASATEAFEALALDQQVVVYAIKNDRSLLTHILLPDAVGFHDDELARRNAVDPGR